MPRFSRDEQPVRSVIVALRVTPAEADAIDKIGEQLGISQRVDVLRAGLDLLAERVAELAATTKPKKGTNRAKS
jgi:hypothetical protein